MHIFQVSVWTFGRLVTLVVKICPESVFFRLNQGTTLVDRDIRNLENQELRLPLCISHPLGGHEWPGDIPYPELGLKTWLMERIFVGLPKTHFQFSHPNIYNSSPRATATSRPLSLFFRPHSLVAMHSAKISSTTICSVQAGPP